MNRQLFGVGISSFLIGAGVGYIFAQRFLERKYEELAETEIADAREYYAKLNKTGEFATPESAAENLLGLADAASIREAAEALTNYAGARPSDEVEEPTLTKVTHNVFTDAKVKVPDFDVDEEMTTRDPDFPYVISHDEYHDNELEYEQIVLTWFAGDQVLVDDHEDPVNTVDDLVKRDNLERFGEGSNDANVVYVRNVDLKTDFEIVRSMGFYSREVLGLDEEDTETELRHSDKYPRIRPSRLLRD